MNLLSKSSSLRNQKRTWKVWIVVLVGLSALASINVSQAKEVSYTTIQLTNNSFDDLSPKISGSKVVWQGGEYDNYEIFFYNGKNTTQLTKNNFNDFAAQISGNNVVWQGATSNNINSFEIFLYNSKATKQLTKNNFYDSYSSNFRLKSGLGRLHWRCQLFSRRRNFLLQR